VDPGELIGSAPRPGDIGQRQGRYRRGARWAAVERRPEAGDEVIQHFIAVAVFRIDEGARQHRQAMAQAGRRFGVAGFLDRLGVQGQEDAAEARVLPHQQCVDARVLEELALIGMSDLRHYTIDDDGHVSLADGAPESAIRAVSSLKRKVRTRTDRDGNTEREVDAEIRLWDKPRGLDMIGKYLAMFVERTEGNLSVRIVREEDGEPASE